MKHGLFTVLLIIGFYFILANTKILIVQYYSIKRMVKTKYLLVFNQIKNIISNTIFIILGFLIYYYKSPYLGCLIMVLSYAVIFTEISLKNYHFTRRNLMLLGLSVVIFSLVSFFLFYEINEFLTCVLLPFISFASLLIAFYCLWPLEAVIKQYYIRKASNKIKRNNYIVIGITGSYGKTTLKNLIYSLLKNKYKISEQNQNFNTLMGLCKYINSTVSDEDDILLVELGVDHQGGMKKFKPLLSLDYAFITEIGEMHLATFKSIDNVAKEKIQIGSLLKENGTLFINDKIDEKYKRLIDKAFISFNGNDLVVNHDFFYQIKYEDSVINTSFISDYQVDYLKASILLAQILHLSNLEIIYGLNHLYLPSRRLKVYQDNNLLIIDDSYNANIKGILNDINLLKETNDYKVIITGGLIELGNKYFEYNYQLGKELKGINKIIFINHNLKHPLVEGYNATKEENLILKKNIYEAKNEIKRIEEKAIVLICASNNEYSLE